MTLAMGIAGAAVPFAVVNGVLLKPLPYPDASRLVVALGVIQPADYLELRTNTKVFERTGLFLPGEAALGSGARSEKVATMSVSRGFFAVVGMRPALGRLFAAGEFGYGRNQVVVISHALWARRFDSNPRTVGRAVTLNGVRYTVVGVAPAGFQFRTEWVYPAVQVWLPLAPSPKQSEARGALVPTFTGKPTELLGTGMLARLRRGTNLQQARAGLAAGLGILASRHAEDKGLIGGLQLYPLRELRTVQAGRTLWPWFGASLLLLLIACANFGGLMLARGIGRMRETAVRVALGAGRLALCKAALVEGLAMALPGAVIGACLTAAGVGLFRATAPAGMLPRIAEVRVDWLVLAFIAAAATMAGEAGCLVPCFMLKCSDPGLVLGEQEGRTGSSVLRAGSRRLGKALVAAQCALATVLVAGAVLMGRSIWMLSELQTGFEQSGLIQADIVRVRGIFDQAEPAAWTPQKDEELWRRVIERINTVPGVASATLAEPGTYGPTPDCYFSTAGNSERGGSRIAAAQYLNVGPRYFRTLSIPILSGRAFGEGDRLGTAGVAVVNQALARRYFGRTSAVGQEIKLSQGGPATGRRLEIIGVAADTGIAGAGADTELQIYTPLLQDPLPVAGILARADGQYDSAVAGLRTAVSNVSGDLALENVAPLPEVISKTLFAKPRFLLDLLVTFGALALMLVCAGVYAVGALAARAQVRDTAVRLALGARNRDVLIPMLGEAGRLSAFGAAAGIGIALWLARFVQAWVFGVAPVDPVTLIAAGGTVLAAGLLAGCAPALAALRVDPAQVMRTG